MKGLETFAYNFTYSSYFEEYTPIFDCLAMMSSLKALASQILEQLKLNAPGIETSEIAPFRGFHVLREIEIETSSCLALEDSKIANLGGVLPVSIERLAMCWHEVTSADGLGTLYGIARFSCPV